LSLTHSFHAKCSDLCRPSSSRTRPWFPKPNVHHQLSFRCFELPKNGSYGDECEDEDCYSAGFHVDSLQSFQIVRSSTHGIDRLFSVRRVRFQFIEIERTWIGVQPRPQSVAFNRALEGQLVNVRLDQRLIRPQKPRGQLVPGMCKGVPLLPNTRVHRTNPDLQRVLDCRFRRRSLASDWADLTIEEGPDPQASTQEGLQRFFCSEPPAFRELRDLGSEGSIAKWVVTIYKGKIDRRFCSARSCLAIVQLPSSGTRLSLSVPDEQHARVKAYGERDRYSNSRARRLRVNFYCGR